MSRGEALAGEHKKAKEGNQGKWDYVDAKAFERMGIPSYQPKVGDNFIRVISPRFTKYDHKAPSDSPLALPMYWKEVWIHSNVGSDKRTFVCNKKQYGEPCAVCELIDILSAQDPEDERIAALWASRRYLFFVYDVTDATTEGKGLHWYDAAKTVKEEIVSCSKDRRKGTYIDISTREEGMDIEYERVGKGLKTKYVGFVLRDNGLPPESWYLNAPDDFDTYILHPSYETVALEVGQLATAVNQQPVRAGRTPRPEAGGVVRDPDPNTPLAETRQQAPVQTQAQLAATTIEPGQVAPGQPVTTQATNPALAAELQKPAVETRQPAQTTVPAAETRQPAQIDQPQQVEVTPVIETRQSAAGGIDPNIKARIDALKNPQ
jgi:hypothetical protein